MLLIKVSEREEQRCFTGQQLTETHLKSTNDEQSINVVLSHLCSNFVNVLRRKCPEEKIKGRKIQKYSFIRRQQLKKNKISACAFFSIWFFNALTCLLPFQNKCYLDLILVCLVIQRLSSNLFYIKILPFGSQQRSTLAGPSAHISPFNLLYLTENTCNN